MLLICICIGPNLITHFVPAPGDRVIPRSIAEMGGLLFIDHDAVIQVQHSPCQASDRLLWLPCAMPLSSSTLHS